VYVVGLPDEGRGDVVDFVLDTPVDDVVDVLLREGGKIDDDSGKVLFIYYRATLIICDKSTRE
jgi:hypothetical protein